jgi:hypothetical protein
MRRPPRPPARRQSLSDPGPQAGTLRVELELRHAGAIRVPMTATGQAGPSRRLPVDAADFKLYRRGNHDGRLGVATPTRTLMTRIPLSPLKANLKAESGGPSPSLTPGRLGLGRLEAPSWSQCGPADRGPESESSRTTPRRPTPGPRPTGSPAAGPVLTHRDRPGGRPSDRMRPDPSHRRFRCRFRRRSDSAGRGPGSVAAPRSRPGFRPRAEPIQRSGRAGPGRSPSQVHPRPAGPGRAGPGRAGSGRPRTGRAGPAREGPGRRRMVRIRAPCWGGCWRRSERRPPLAKGDCAPAPPLCRDHRFLRSGRRTDASNGHAHTPTGHETRITGNG